MNWLELAAESSIRTVVLAAVVALILLRARTPQMRLMAWTSVVYASLLMPTLPVIARQLIPAEPLRLSVPVQWKALTAGGGQTAPSVDWAAILVTAYFGAAAVLFARTLTGLALTAGLARRAASIAELGPGVHQSDEIAVPVSFGKKVLLPAAWRDWDNVTLQTVLAHERSHVERADTLTLLLARIHRDLFWFNPLSWWLVTHLTDLAEQASDDAAILANNDRPHYAEILVQFASRARHVPKAGLAMARTSNVVRRVDRILDAAFRPGGTLSWQSRAALLAATVPLILGIAAVQAHSQTRPEKTRWVLVENGRVSMDGGNGDEQRARSFSGRFQQPYLWVRNGEGEFVIDDRSTLGEIAALWKPMEELGKKQAELGKEQAKLGEQQAELGKQQAAAAVPAPDLEREIREIESRIRVVKGKNVTQVELGDLQASIGAMQDALGKAQAAAGGVQAVLGEKQARLGEQQAVLGGKQAVLGDQQAALAAKALSETTRLIAEAIRSGKAKRI